MSLKDPDVKPENIIRDYDALYAVRTGLTLLIPKNDTFAGGVDVPVHFRVSSANPRDRQVRSRAPTRARRRARARRGSSAARHAASQIVSCPPYPPQIGTPQF